jgi:hypothetical protein
MVNPGKNKLKKLKKNTILKRKDKFSLLVPSLASSHAWPISTNKS